MFNQLFTAAGSVIFEMPARRRRLTELMIALQASGQRLSARCERLSGSDHNRRILSHIIGIERWGQRRLRVMLGEPFVQDEYDGYRPTRDTAWDDLRRQFSETRMETIRLIGSIERVQAVEMKVIHNMWGELSARGWLNYLNVHADVEMLKMW
jgi:hypothetical protein